MSRRRHALAGIALAAVGCRDDPMNFSFDPLPPMGCAGSSDDSVCLPAVPYFVAAWNLDELGGDEVVVRSRSSFVTVLVDDQDDLTPAVLRADRPGPAGSRIVECDMDRDGRQDLVDAGAPGYADLTMWTQGSEVTEWIHHRGEAAFVSSVHCADGWAPVGEPLLVGVALGPSVVAMSLAPDGRTVTRTEMPLGLPESVFGGHFGRSLLGRDGEYLLLLGDPEEGTVHVTRLEDDSWVAAADVVVGEGPPIDAVVTDVDRDGVDEVVVLTRTDDEQAMIWVGEFGTEADGYLSQRFSASVGAATAFWPVFLDGDGDIDLLVARLPGIELHWLQGLGDGTFASARGVGFEPSDDAPLIALTPADLDGDGVPELAVLPLGRDRLDIIRDFVLE